MSSTRMPALFLGHGSPMNVLEDNLYTRSWQKLGMTLPRPQAIVVVSAHWFTRGTGVTAMETPPTDTVNYHRATSLYAGYAPRCHWRPT
ncbi:dioxygenase family protein, partial [Escherichia coli]|uniref:dioxygenase family protein n=1 Tax=Escherichia coli TaxID=562 RepID=UPI003D80A6F1